MFFPSGLINIRNILITSFIIQLVATLIIFPKIVKDEITYVPLQCNAVRTFDLDRFDHTKYAEFKKTCDSLKEYYSGPHDLYYKYLAFDLDSRSYFLSLARINHLFYGLKYHENKNYDENSFLKESKIKLPEGFFDTRDNKNYSNKNLNLLNKIEKLHHVSNFLKKEQINHFEILKPYSNLYVKIFDNNNYVYEFILFLNMVALILITIFLFKISRILFSSISSKLILLCVLNIIINPVFWIYFVSFYRENLILLTLILLIFNYVYLLSLSEINLKNLFFPTFLVLMAFYLIFYIKFQYFHIYFVSYLIGIFFIIFQKVKKIKPMLAQFFVVLVFSITISNSNFLNKISLFKIDFIKKVESISDNKVDSDENIILEILNRKIVINLVDKEVIQKDSSEDDNVKIINEFSEEKTEDYNILNYYFPVPAQEKLNQFTEIECPFFIPDKICKKINSFTFRIFSIKQATLWENSFNSENLNVNNNIINPYDLNSSKKILLQVPVSMLKLPFMPILLNDNKMVKLLSLFKLFTSFFCIVFLVILYKRKKYNILFSIIGIFGILFPLGLAVELTSSNFFTYFRYVYPINIFILLILYLTFTYSFRKSNNLKND